MLWKRLDKKNWDRKELLLGSWVDRKREVVKIKQESKSYIPSCIKRLIISWHTQLIVYAKALILTSKSILGYFRIVAEISIMPNLPRNEKVWNSFIALGIYPEYITLARMSEQNFQWLAIFLRPQLVFVTASFW